MKWPRYESSRVRNVWSPSSELEHPMTTPTSNASCIYHTVICFLTIPKTHIHILQLSLLISINKRQILTKYSVFSLTGYECKIYNLHYGDFESLADACCDLKNLPMPENTFKFLIKSLQARWRGILQRQFQLTTEVFTVRFSDIITNISLIKIFLFIIQLLISIKSRTGS